MPLTAKACQAAQPKESPYKLADGGGMYLEVMPNGSKYWRLEMHVFPYIGNRPVSQITPPELLDCLRKVEKTGALDMAGRAGVPVRYPDRTVRT